MNLSIQSVLLAGALLVLPTIATAQSSEHDAVNQVMQTMMRGFEAGDANLIFETFRRDAVLVGYVESKGQVASQTAEDWAKGFTGKPADDEAQRKRSYKILDVTENAAVVQMTLDYPSWDGLDYLSLTKIGGEWKIVSKSWSGHRKPSAP